MIRGLNRCYVPWKLCSTCRHFSTISQAELYQTVRACVPPRLSSEYTLGTLNWVKGVTPTPGGAAIQLELPPVWPQKMAFVRHVQEQVAQRVGCEVDAVQVTVTKKKVGLPAAAAGIGKDASGLAHVTNAIAVSSGKGGVGKSTVAVNLAMALSGLGATVGILDADVYGPSLPYLISPAHPDVQQLPSGRLAPVVYEHVAAMSYGFVAKKNAHGEREGASMRGPLVSQVISQLARFTEWGELDFLIVDLPPGTGDIHITLGQELAFAGAVTVTTPARLAHADVVKGLRAWQAMRIPNLALVQNMSYFRGDDGKVYRPLGPGHADKLSGEFGDVRLVDMPMHADAAACGELGVPLVVSQPSSEMAKAYGQLAFEVAVGATQRVLQAGARSFVVMQQPDSARLVIREFTRTEAKEHSVSAKHARAACTCAACVDELSGKQLVQLADIPDTIWAQSVEPVGNYGVRIRWSDGHSSGIYAYEDLLQLASEEQAHAAEHV